MEKIEGVVDEADAAVAVAGGLGLRKARQIIVANPAQFAVEIGRLRRELYQRGDHARKFAGPVEPGPREQLRPSALDARGHAEAVELDLVDPLRPRRAASVNCVSWGGIQRGSGETSLRPREES